MSSKLSLETEIAFFIDEYKAMSSILIFKSKMFKLLWLPNWNLFRMKEEKTIFKPLESFSGHCYTVSDQLGR